MNKFKINEKVRVKTRFYKWQSRFWLPDEVLYYGMEDKKDKTAVISWHGTIHRIPIKDIFKMESK